VLFYGLLTVHRNISVQCDKQDELVSSLLRINSLYMFRALLLIIRWYCIHSNCYILCVLCRLAATRFGVEPWYSQLT
jgi:hypothetical protein